MKILVIGGGGREHALAWKLHQSPQVKKIWCVPGNGGIAQVAECVSADPGDVAGLADLASRLGADLTVVGPELPLVLGVADEFSRRGLAIVAPSKAAAQLEGSKVFAKRFLVRHGIPTARMLGVYESAADACDGLRSLRGPVVLKADGLCAGKGVLVAGSFDEARRFVSKLIEERELGDGGARVMAEEALTGQELSFIILSDGNQFVPLVPTRDHKRVFDADRGPNTGGMGAYSSDDLISREVEQVILDNVVRPTLAGLAADGCPYRGFLYFGLMLTADGPKVLEFNCRLGDPETQPIMMRADFDLAEALSATATARLTQSMVKWLPGASACVVMASSGYPGKYEAGKQITGLQEAGAMKDVEVFHAGTRLEGKYYYTHSGRVLGVTARGADLGVAVQRAYDAIGEIHFEGAQYRKDIAAAGIDSRAATD
jgi:phosphoribosylamine--glycine ligase